VQGAQITVMPLSLASLDELPVPDLALFVGTDERPLQDLAGLADWRLCGGLTRQLRAEFVTGAPGESLLTVPGRQLPSARRIFVFGAGAWQGKRVEEAVALLGPAFATIRRAGGDQVAMTPPGWGRFPHDALATAVVDAAAGAGLARVVLLAPDPREAEHVVRGPAQRRGLAVGNLPHVPSVLGSKH
jgi:hypothetical protein